MELQRVKQRYEEAILKVDEAGKTIENLFKKKVRAIKEKSALFFAKLEMKLQENNKEVVAISGMFREWQETIQGPTQKYDAKIFTLQSIMEQQEMERETEFGLVKELMKKMVYALEDKAGADLIHVNNVALQ